MAKMIPEANIQLVVGLGNPGAEYVNTRHNAGAILVEGLARKFGSTLHPEKKFHGEVAQVKIKGRTLHLLIPTTYMNLSGKAVQAYANFYKIPPEAILVAHDELDLAPGIARLKQGGGHGGHNGLRDIINKLGNCKDFFRLRIGIGHPGIKEQVVGFVLSRAPRQEQDLIDAVSHEAIHLLPEAITGSWQLAVQQLHRFKG